MSGEAAAPRRRRRAKSNDEADALAHLSAEERRARRLLLDGADIEAIAEALGCSEADAWAFARNPCKVQHDSNRGLCGRPVGSAPKRPAAALGVSYRFGGD